MMDYKPFLSGIIEGFYGTSWTHSQRTSLFEKMKLLRLNSYIYAPKDDSKHRKHWRDLYNQDELEIFRRMIDSCRENHVEFFYALSPGLDMTYSSEDEFHLLFLKCDQLHRIGCNSFGLFFDDIEHTLGETDQRRFTCLAGAQVSVTNRLFQALGCPHFLFCPTIYCLHFAKNTNSLEYLVTMGMALMAGIDIMWTGDSVVSTKITEDSIKEINSILHREVVIWDNLHSNDSRENMVNLGPYSFRDQAVLSMTRGVFLNPNTEFEANTVPIITFAEWINSHCDVEAAFKKAQLAWLEDMNSSVDDESEIFLELKEVDDSEPMEIDKLHPIDTPLGDLRLDELESFIDLFYLPFDFRPAVKEMLSVYQWLIDNSGLAAEVEWRERKEWILGWILQVDSLLDRMCQIRNRVIFRELSHYIHELRWALQHVSVLVSWLGGGYSDFSRVSKDCVMSDNSLDLSTSVLSSSMLINELKMMQPVGLLFDLKHIRSFYPSRNYRLRVYDPAHYESVHRLGRIWFDSHWPGVEDIDKISDLCLEAMLELEPHLAFVMCDAVDGPVGFAVCCGQIKEYLPKFRMLYQSSDVHHGCVAAEMRGGAIEDICGGMALLRMCVIDDLCDPNAVLNLFETVSMALQLCGVDDVCVEVGGHDCGLMSLYCERLGFYNVHVVTETCCFHDNIYLCARSLK